MFVRCIPVLILLLPVFFSFAHAAPVSPSLEKMAGAMLMFGFREAGLEADSPLLEQIRRGELGGVLLFDKDAADKGPRNVHSPEQLRELIRTLQEAAPDLLLVAVDQEGGRVRRLKPRHGFADLPSAAELGALPPNAVYDVGRRLGSELRDLGININLAPVADVNINPACPIVGALDRSFGAFPEEVSGRVLAFGFGLAASGVAPCLKHFPGHGSAAVDSHHGLPDITATWNEQAELAPYASAFAAGWPGLVLTGHLYHAGLDPRLPSSLSPAVVQDLLRRRLGWNGVIITDDLQMQAAAGQHSLEERILLAVNAGNDILVFGNNTPSGYHPELPRQVHATLLRLVRQGRIAPDRIVESWQRIQNLRQRLAAGRLIEETTFENIFTGRFPPATPDQQKP